MGKIKARQNGRIIWENIFRNWLHQAFLYMDKGEKSLKIYLEIFSTVLLFMLFLKSVDSILFALFISIFIVHTLNWIFNGNIWALLLFSLPNMKNSGEKKTCDYLNKVTERLKKSNCISGIMLFGSASRGKWHDKSDIDLRILRKKGIINLLLAYCIMLRERFLAAVYMQPADMFLADNVVFLRKMRSDEKPIFLLKRDERLDHEYPGVEPVVIKRLRN